jgi:uncharacterized repeat protein (TIGR04076 family)
MDVFECPLNSSAQDYSGLVRIRTIKSKCKYHKHQGQEFRLAEMVPEGLCPSLFFRAYPGALSALYAGSPSKWGLRTREDRERKVACPMAGGVTLNIASRSTAPRFLVMLKEVLEQIMRFLGRGVDLPLRKVDLIITSVGLCPRHRQSGEVFEFNVDKNEELCPAAFSSIYPYIGKQSDLIYPSRTNVTQIHCPDYRGLEFELVEDAVDGV